VSRLEHAVPSSGAILILFWFHSGAVLVPFLTGDEQCLSLLVRLV
jgi:hypothetical protein